MATIGFRFLSWNLDNFGKYDYSGTMGHIAKTILDSGADIFVILEVYSQGTAQGNSKQVKIGDNLATANAVASVNALLAQLTAMDAGSAWKSAISGVNAGNDERDSYAFFWKTKTPGGALGANLLPTDITLLTGPDLVFVDSEGKSLKGRRPCVCGFRFDNAAAVPATNVALIWAFHADATFGKPSKIMKSVKGCVSAAYGEAAIEKIPVVIGGDFNISYNSNNEDFYEQLDEDFAFETALVDSEGTSLLANPNFSVPAPTVAEKAYDNFLYHGVTLLNNPPARVINVVDILADGLPQTDASGKKRNRNDLVEEAYSLYHTKKKSVLGISSISDHFPVIGAFGF